MDSIESQLQFIFAYILKMPVVRITMYQTVIKYLSVVLLLLLFISKGVITILPLFTDFCCKDEQQEMQMNSKSENTEENNNEKRIEIKEFLGHFYNGHTSSIKYAPASQIIFPGECQSEREVFLPVNTPPPKLVG